MPTSVERISYFVLGIAVTIAGISMLGATAPVTAGSSRTIDFDPLLGGLGGMLTVTDPGTDKAYLYMMRSEVSNQNIDNSKTPPPPLLVATIDLSSAGQPTLAVEFHKPPENSEAETAKPKPPNHQTANER